MKHKQDHHQTECRTAENHLSTADPIMKRLIAEHGPCELEGSRHSLFHSLASAVIAQQLSVKAAATIQGRVMKLTSKPMMPKHFLSAKPEDVRSAGLSRSKDAYIRNIARAIVDDGLSKRKLQGMDDAQVIHELTTIKGIGQWTAEMYLMFGLRRLDVVSLGDVGLQRAARELYNNGKPKEHLLSGISETWKPYRTIACWYLWKSTD